MPRFFVDPDISIAKTIDTSMYTFREVYEEIKEKIFAPAWQFAMITDVVRESGTCHQVTSHVTLAICDENATGGCFIWMADLCQCPNSR